MADDSHPSSRAGVQRQSREVESDHSGTLHCSTRLLLLVLDQRTGAPFEVEGPSAQGRYPSSHRLMNQILLLITSVGREITQHHWSSGFSFAISDRECVHTDSAGVGLESTKATTHMGSINVQAPKPRAMFRFRDTTLTCNHHYT